ncbi:putative amino acid adenylation domain-containing protein [Rosellinia necatrix]|uniref:Putative amino acid adenylation domain-containing protein n=1 Tax=Rosellinia necatrix TaxID=77044 RepID=A0A1W2TLZ0_ROSNE|nr:putative amino acid adenylation domain-containing protein [Rosellinia necatrix]
MSFHSIENLSLEDQRLFNQFGKAPRVSIPFEFIHKAFESIVDSHPHITAIRHYDGTTITYQDLERRANILSHQLIQRGLRPNGRVCIVVSRSIELVVGILAVLKAGAQYVPLDGGIVADAALEHIFGDTEARTILCLSKFRAKVEPHALKTGADIMELDAMDPKGLFGNEERPRVVMDPNFGAYIVYTSGTTGKPKGVDVRHRTVVNNLLVEPANMKITVGKNVAQLLNISFDMAQWEMLATLMNGGTLHIRNGNWTDVLRRVDTVIATPTVLGKFAQADFPNIKTVAVGGEPCPVPLAEEWSPHADFWNICGPTEITILNTAHLHKPGELLTIGRPLPNTNLYVLDDDENPVAIGQPGLMWAGGACVSAGYVNLPELTATRFKLDKFAQDGTMMFNTGDLGRWTEDGRLIPLGRKDDQVKIKGFRVELDGVSAAVESAPSVTKACALVINDKLWAFYSAPGPLDEDLMSRIVGKTLPYYAVPTEWLYIASIPLTANGKFDKRKLREMAEAQKGPREAVSSESLASTSPSTAIATDSHTTPSTSTADLEKGDREPDSSSPVALEEEDTKYELPSKNGFHGQRWLRHRFFSLYRRFFSFIFFGNLLAFALVWWKSWGSGSLPLSQFPTAIAVNLLVAVAMRQDHVINFLFWLATRMPTSAPLAIRRQCARVFHIGGIHSGAAVSAVLWWLIFTIGATVNFARGNRDVHIDAGTIALSYLVLALLLAIVGMAHPDVRAKMHDQFEWTHRFAGWTATALVWAHLVVGTNSLKPNTQSLADALARTPAVYLLALITLSIALPWLRLRRVTVRPEPLSKHAIRLHFDFETPIAGKAIRISDKPMREWHAFATIDKPGEKGFSIVVSNAGDWTRKTIDGEPQKLWTRGALASGVLTIAPLFKKVVLVATGSGIGPCLPVILEGRVPARILWSTPHPRETFGDEIIGNVMQADPKAIIWNTRTQGKPDLTALSYQMLKESGAEAVCIISNKKVTQQLVYRLEARGVPAFGAIFDS